MLFIIALLLRIVFFGKGTHNWPMALHLVFQKLYQM